VAISIFFVINDKNIISGKNSNGVIANLVLMLIVAIMIFLGVFHLLRVAFNAFKISSDLNLKMTIAGIISFITIVYMATFIIKKSHRF
jgi:hypothetical protein